MSRLTNRDNEIFVGARCVGKSYFTRVFNKLSQLEDIEDELGIELSVLFKALKEGVFWIFDCGKKYIEFTKEVKGLRLDNDGWFIHEGWFDIGCPIKLYLKDYGKTWALTKEELE